MIVWVDVNRTLSGQGEGQDMGLNKGRRRRSGTRRVEDTLVVYSAFSGRETVWRDGKCIADSACEVSEVTKTSGLAHVEAPAQA